MTKIILAVSIIVFWVFFPFGVMLMDSDNFMFLDTSMYEKKDYKQPTLLDTVTGMWDFVKIYFRSMYMIIPNAPPFISLLVLVMQIVSGLLIYIFVRGE